MLFNPLAWRIRLHLWAGAALIGVLAIFMTKSSIFLDSVYLQLAQNYPLLPVLITPAGMVSIVWLIRNYFPGSQGGGIPQTIASLQTRSRDGLLSARIFTGKIITLLAALACGASVGIGGPMVHISASIMYVMARLARYAPRQMQNRAIIAGGGAALAAVFSAPLAGLVFALEEIIRSFKPGQGGIIVISVLISSLVIYIGTDQQQYFGELSYQFVDSGSWLAALVCGVAGGLFGGLFSQSIILITRKTLGFTTNHPYLLALICGLVIAIIGISSDTPIYGTSYQITVNIVQNPTQEHDMLFPFAKLLATGAAFLSGVPSGIFGPSIGIGAGIGADLAQITQFAPAEIMIMMGIAAYFAAVFQTPITASILVLEITGNQEIILPVIGCAYIAFVVSRIICPTPIYHALASGILMQKDLLKPGNT